MMNDKQRHTFTFLSRTAPYGSNRPQLCLDAALAAAVFEQPVNYVFIEDGVFQLLKDQDATAINSKTLGLALETLELYGIENIYVDKDSMAERNLNLDQLVIPANIITSNDLQNLLTRSDTVINL